MWMRGFCRRLAVLFRRGRFDRDLEEEMQFHLELQAEENREAGMNATEAGYAAKRRFGNAMSLKELSREVWGWGSLEKLGQDLTYAARVLQKNPGFTFVVVLILALGIGANTAIFSAVNALLLNPLPFPEPDRLVLVELHHVSKSSGAHFRDFLDWRERNAVFQEMAIVAGTRQTWTGQAEPQPIEGMLATSGLLRVMDVQPLLGRFFTAEEDRPGAPPVVVLSFTSWQNRFGGREDVIGHVLVLNGKPHTVIGVLPRGFVSPWWAGAEFWVPLRENPAAPRSGQQYRRVFARLKSEVTLRQAQANITAITRGLEQQYPETNRGWRAVVLPALPAMRGTVGKPLALLLAVVVIVLVLACANVAGLMLARASGRAREMAVRAALGAGRLRIIRQLLTESALLAVLGGMFGLVLSRWLLDVLRSAAPPAVGPAATLHIDSTVLGFTLMLSLMTGILFGLGPAWYGSKTDLHSALKGGAGAVGGARSRNRFLSALVVGEVALSLILLVVSGLLMRDFQWLLHVDTGIRTDRVLTFLLDLPRAKYTTPAQRTTFYRDLLTRLRATPGVEAVGAVSTLPMGGNKSGGRFEVEGQPQAENSGGNRAVLYDSSPGYFRTVGIPLLKGRDFDDRDTSNALPVAIIDDMIARRFFPGQEPIGRTIKLENGPPMTIVGVVGSVKHDGPWYDTEPQIHSPFSQSSNPEMFVAVRCKGEPMQLAAAVREMVASLDRNLPMERMRTMEQVFADSLSAPRLLTSFLALFGAFGLFQAAIGIYGIIDYSVTQRTREMGLRIALGASPTGIFSLIIWKCAKLVAAGVAIGVPSALAVSPLMRSPLAGISPRDLTVFTVVPIVLMAAAFVASYLPARRAVQIDPMKTLRHE